MLCVSLHRLRTARTQRCLTNRQGAILFGCSHHSAAHIDILSTIRAYIHSENIIPLVATEIAAKAVQNKKRYAKRALLILLKALCVTLLKRDMLCHLAPSTRKRHANIDTLLKYCTCHAKRKRYLRMSQNATKARYLRGYRPPARHPDHILWAPPNGEA